MTKLLISTNEQAHHCAEHDSTLEILKRNLGKKESLEIEEANTKVADIETEEEAIELKYGKDVLSSANNNDHFFDQAQRLADCGKEGYLMMMDTPNFHMDMQLFKRINHTTMRYGILFYHCRTEEELCKHIWRVISGDPEYHHADSLQPLRFTHKRTDDNMKLINSFYILVPAGKKFACEFIKSDWISWVDVVRFCRLDPLYIENATFRFYQKNMKKLNDYIHQKIGC